MQKRARARQEGVPAGSADTVDFIDDIGKEIASSSHLRSKKRLIFAFLDKMCLGMSSKDAESASITEVYDQELSALCESEGA